MQTRAPARMSVPRNVSFYRDQQYSEENYLPSVIRRQWESLSRAYVSESSFAWQRIGERKSLSAFVAMSKRYDNTCPDLFRERIYVDSPNVAYNCTRRSLAIIRNFFSFFHSFGFSLFPLAKRGVALLKIIFINLLIICKLYIAFVHIYFINNFAGYNKSQVVR